MRKRYTSEPAKRLKAALDRVKGQIARKRAEIKGLQRDLDSLQYARSLLNR